MVRTLTTVAMMALCRCFARRVNLDFEMPETAALRKSLFRQRPATVHGVVFAFIVAEASLVPRGGMRPRKRDCQFRRDRYS